MNFILFYKLNLFQEDKIKNERCTKRRISTPVLDQYEIRKSYEQFIQVSYLLPNVILTNVVYQLI